jgi:anti-sigma regulatory factor (Ser/Thr protein kinase)
VTALAPDIALTVAARPESVALVRQALAGMCEALGVPERVADDVRIAVTEACTNAVVHAYEADHRASVEIEAAAQASLLTVLVRDAGRGMGRWSEAGGLGLGLPLIAALTQNVEVRTGPADSGTEVVMTFDVEAHDDD